MAIKRSYNGLDQVTSLRSSEGDLDYEFYYHPSGKVEFAFDRLKKTRVYREHDAFGRLLSEQQQTGIKVSYAYDDLHGKIEMTLPSWGSIRYIMEIFILKRSQFKHANNKILILTNS